MVDWNAEVIWEVVRWNAEGVWAVAQVNEALADGHWAAAVVQAVDA